MRFQNLAIGQLFTIGNDNIVFLKCGLTEYFIAKAGACGCLYTWPEADYRKVVPYEM